VVEFPVCSYAAFSACPRDIFFSTPEPNRTASSSSNRMKILSQRRGGAAGKNGT
jgi:hypothetical protein